MSERYYNLFNAQKKYTSLRFLAGDGLQSRELNEIQDTLRHHVEGIANAILKEGDPVSGADISVNEDTGLVSMEAGEVYLRGRVHEVAAAELTIPTDERVAVGLRYSSKIITHLEDPSLRDPSSDTRNANEPGAQRTQEVVQWGFEAENTSDGEDGEFHAVYTVVNGILENKTQPPALDAVVQTIARYDREANGSYVAEGMNFKFLSRDGASGDYTFSLSEGTGNVNGYKVEKPQATRIIWEDNPDMRAVNSEPHAFNDGGSGTATLTMNRSPINTVTEITITKEATESVTHGAFTGASDSLQHTAVLSIESVSQGGTTFDEGTDFVRSGDEVDWSPNGNEPAPGSTYDVTYRYIDTINPDSVTDTEIEISGAVTGTTVFVDYTWKMPRIDTLAMDENGTLYRIEGVSQVVNPQAPTVSDNLLVLANVLFEWYTGVDPSIASRAVRAIPISDLEQMQTDIELLYDLVAIERLRNDTNIADPTAKYGVFVDPFMDDDLRDQGIAQTAAIVDEHLTLPINAAVLDAPNGATATHTLDYELVTALEQLQSTRNMKINPYQNFDPVPADIVLSPPSDNWTVVNEQWTSAITRSFVSNMVRNIGGGFRAAVSRSTTVSRTTSTRVTNETATAILTARQRTVSFVVENFDAGEVLDTLTFDGIEVSPDSVTPADVNGRLTGEFTIPPNVPTGTKAVTFLGSLGSFGSTSFVSNGWLITRELTRVTNVRITNVTTVRRFDPLAQTFTLDNDTVIGAIDLWFDVIGDVNNECRVQIRETQVGFPDQTVVAEMRLDMNTVSTVGVTTCEFTPAFLRGGTEYAIVILTDDPDHAVRVAELGKYDPDNGWVTSQPYTIGVLLSSSNASTWTAHQDRDLKFRLRACNFTSDSKTIDLGQVNVTDATDFIALAGVERLSSETDVQFVLRDSAGTEFVIADGQALNLTERVSDTLDLEARLIGSSGFTPILFPGVQAIAGNLQETGDYVSRAFQSSATFEGVVRLDVLDPGTSNVSVYMESGTDDNWVELTLDTATPVGNGFEERVYSADNLQGVGDEDTTAIKIVMTGSPANRPFVRNLRGFAK